MEQQRNAAATKLAVKHYLNQMKLDWKTVLPTFILPAFGTILVFYVPTLIIAKVLSNLGKQSHPNPYQFLPYLLLFIALWAFGELLWRIGIHYLIKAETNGVYRLYTQAMDYLFQKDIAFFHNNFAGSLTKRVTSYSWRYIDLMDALTFNIFASYVPIIFVAIVLWRFSPWLVFTLLLMMLIAVIIVMPFVKRRQALVAARETANTNTSGYVADIISNMDAVKAFANESMESKKHHANVNDFMVKAKKSWDYQNLRIDAILSPFSILTNAVGLTIALIIAQHSTISLQVVFITFNYYAGVTRTLWEFSNVYRRLESTVTEGAQFTELLLDEPTVKDPAQHKPFTASKGEIEMRGVRFSYSDNEGEHLFNGFNLNIAPGEKIALVGHSGGGKTTVTKLLLRFMDIDDGEILIDGQNIAEISQHDLRRAIAYVPQEPVMFHRTLTDNIKYGKLNSNDELVEKTARLAHAHRFIKKLPQGYDTLVGERGVKLSGGQRQRIAIARAMIKDAPILVLDEATSALDSESEKLIQDALWKLMEGRTAIVIAHRLSTIQKMDRIVVLSEGEIAEEGSHKELLENNGIYASLWAHQSGGFLED